jgi:2-oxoglutarate ferredoxin oxidoreductase subunit alpha
MNVGQISREVKRVNRWKCRVEKYNRIDGQLITPGDIYQRIMKILT